MNTTKQEARLVRKSNEIDDLVQLHQYEYLSYKFKKKNMFVSGSIYNLITRLTYEASKGFKNIILLCNLSRKLDMTAFQQWNNNLQTLHPNNKKTFNGLISSRNNVNFAYCVKFHNNLNHSADIYWLQYDESPRGRYWHN